MVGGAWLRRGHRHGLKAGGHRGNFLSEEMARPEPGERAFGRQAYAGRAAARDGAPSVSVSRLIKLRKHDCKQINQAPEEGSNAKMVQLASVNGVGVETADMLTQESVLARSARSADGRRVCRAHRFPRRERSTTTQKGARHCGKCAGASRHDPAGLAFSPYTKKDSALVNWYHNQAHVAGSKRRKTMIVALARKLLIALWRFVMEVPEALSCARHR
jgi:hypothetical protein